MKSLVFLSGLPRTGTTVLASLLNQNPKLHCTSTSGLLHFLSGVDYTYQQVSQRYKATNSSQLKNIFKSICNSYYSHIEQDIVIDKWRGWMGNIPQIKEVICDAPKIICTYRPIEEIAASFLALLENDPDNFVDIELKKSNIILDNDNRAKYLWNTGVIGETYDMFESCLQYKNEICYISYSDIVNNSDKTFEKVYSYLNIEYFNHTYNNINDDVNDNDDYWQIKNLHCIRNKLKLQYKNPHDYMTKNLVENFKSYNKIFTFIEK